MNVTIIIRQSLCPSLHLNHGAAQSSLKLHVHIFSYASAQFLSSFYVVSETSTEKRLLPIHLTKIYLATDKPGSHEHLSTHRKFAQRL